MNRADAIVNERRRLASRYDEAFAELDWLQTPVCFEGFEHGYQSYPCMFRPDDITLDSIVTVNAERNAWMEELQALGISTRPATHAVHMLSFYAKKYGLKPESFPIAYAANHCSISLPLFHGMTEDEQGHVISAIRKAQI